MVRSHSKMVQRPISDNSGGNWGKMSHTMSQEFYPGLSQVNSVVHKMQRPKISTILSSIDTGKSRTLVSRMSIAKTENVQPFELRAARGAAADVLRSSDHNFLFDDYNQHDLGNVSNIDNDVDKTVNSLKTSNFFYSINTLKTNHTSDNDDIILIPSDIQPHAQSVNLTKNITSNTDSILNINKVAEERLLNLIKPALDVDKDKAECVTQVQIVTEKTCHVLKEAAADIETEKTFSGFDIEVNVESNNYLYFNSFSFTLCPANSMVGRGNIVLSIFTLRSPLFTLLSEEMKIISSSKWKSKAFTVKALCRCATVVIIFFFFHNCPFFYSRNG